MQLLFLHLRNNLLLIGMWVFVVLLLTGTIADLYGVKYLFLSPEYLDEVGFKSFFILGAAFGGFFMTWNLTTYLLDAHHFPFLASMKRPFTKFILNNFIVPLTFLAFYFTYTIWFQRYFEYWAADVILANCVGFLLGVVLMLLLSSFYFQFTNKDIFNFSKKRKFRLRDFFNWKKKKGRISQKPDSLKEVPLSANLSAMFASAGNVTILFLWVLGARYSFSIPFLIFPILTFGFVAAIILGFIGLRKIKSDQDKYGGKRIAWFGLAISFIWIWIFCLLFISFL